METRYYGAFGSNLSQKQMKVRCPASTPFKPSYLENYMLTFKSVADVVPYPKKRVPIGIYSITTPCEAALDQYESYPHLYTKKFVNLAIAGDFILVMIYVMNKEYGFGKPSEAYYRVIEEGYNDWGIDHKLLVEARDYSIQNDKGEAFRSKRWDNAV